MPKNAYDRLSFLDNPFLIMEASTSPMYVAGMATFEAGPLRTADGGIDIDKIRAYGASRLHLIPRYRQRLVHVPIENHPVWMDDEHVARSAPGRVSRQLDSLDRVEVHPSAGRGADAARFVDFSGVSETPGTLYAGTTTAVFSIQQAVAEGAVH